MIRAQVSLEFMVWIGVGLLMFTLLWYGTDSFRQRLTLNRALAEVHALCEEIALEVNSALEAGTGYAREFYVPQTLYGVAEFRIRVQNYSVLIEWDEMSTLCPVAVENIVGSIERGPNLIKNVDGVIFVS